MKKRNKHFNKLGTFPSIAIGTGTAVFLTLLLAGVAATLMNAGRYRGNSETLLQLSIQFVSSIVGAIVALAITQDKKAVCAFLVVTMYIFIMIGTAILLFSGLSAAVLGGIVACYAGGFVSILVANRKTGSIIKRKKRTISR